MGSCKGFNELMTPLEGVVILGLWLTSSQKSGSGMGCICSRHQNRIHPVAVTPLKNRPDNHLQLAPTATSTSDKLSKIFAPAFNPWRKQPQSAERVGVPTSPEELWSLIDGRCQFTAAKRLQKSARDRAWKTVHVYVASTFADFLSVCLVDTSHIHSWFLLGLLRIEHFPIGFITANSACIANKL